MLVNILYWMGKKTSSILVALLPVELIIRLFWFMPGRLVVDILKLYGAEIGENVKIMLPIIFHNFNDHSQKPFQNLHIGYNSFLGRDCFLDLMGEINIEDNVTIAMGVTIVTHMDVGYSTVRQYFPNYAKAITIQPGAYIGARATIIAPVEIGSGALIGAGSLVIKNVPSKSVFAGVPAKKIRNLGGESQITDEI
jgi:acetyltransferase-like isoleucine patch superfamily enzyme